MHLLKFQFLRNSYVTVAPPPMKDTVSDFAYNLRISLLYMSFMSVTAE